MRNVKTNQMNARRCNSERAGVKITSWLNNNFRLLALTLLAVLSVNVVWGEEKKWDFSTDNLSSKSPITLTYGQGSASNNTTITSNTLRLFANRSAGKGSWIKFEASTGYEITAVSVTGSNNQSYARYGVDAENTGDALTNSFSFSNNVATVSSLHATSFAIKNGQNSGSSNKTVAIASITITYASTSSKTLSSISVKTDPSKVTYTEGDKFDPTGLIITKKYSDNSTEDWAYADHASDFTFSPSTSTALTTSNTSVTITVGGKSTTQSITVNAKSKYTVTFYNAGEVVKTVSDVTEGTLFSAIKPTIGTGSGQLNIESCDNNSTHFMGWTAEESFQKRKTKPSYVADNDAINDNMTVRAVWAAEE